MRTEMMNDGSNAARKLTRRESRALRWWLAVFALTTVFGFSPNSAGWFALLMAAALLGLTAAICAAGTAGSIISKLTAR